MTTKISWSSVPSVDSPILWIDQQICVPTSFKNNSEKWRTTIEEYQRVKSADLLSRNPKNTSSRQEICL